MVKECLIEKATTLFFEIDRERDRVHQVPSIWYESAWRRINKLEDRLNTCLAPMNDDDLEEYLRRTSQ